MPYDGIVSGVSQTIADRAAPRQVSPGPRAAPGSFAESLARAAGGQSLKFSAHAASRLASRNIRFTADEMARVEQAADLAARKGSRDALLMMENLGLVVNVRNRTVLTALDLDRTTDGVVTNIDSTVFVRR